MTEPGAPGRLLELGVTDLALIDRLRLELGDGLNVITGETGAGKSLLIDALGLALGARADTSLVRHGADSARVEALFDRIPEPVIAVREVAASGRSTARLDDATVTAARLAEEVGPLVEIHGQHEQQRLLDERWPRDLLDAFGGHGELREEMAGVVERWRANRSALAELAIEPRELARRIDLLEHEAAEIQAARLRPGEAGELRARLEAAQHGEAIARGAAALRDALVGEGSGARDVTAVAVREVRNLARIDARFEPLEERLGGLEAELEDVAAEVRRLADTVDHDATTLAALEERLGLIYALERRYGDDEAAVIARREADDAELLEAVAQTATRLSKARTSAAADLASAVGAVLGELGFPDGVFEVALGRRPAGKDEAAVELNGGELSRVALAVKQVLAEADDTPTLVFDEVDTGIGGRSADPVGRSLWALARRHQVLCVTHLPQIAAHADIQYRITKRERDGRTVTEVERLDREGRIVELAQMLGGATGGATALASARELLDRAEGWREGVGAAG